MQKMKTLLITLVKPFVARSIYAFIRKTSSNIIRAHSRCVAGRVIEGGGGLDIARFKINTRINPDIDKITDKVHHHAHQGKDI